VWAATGDPLGDLSIPTGGGALALLAVVLVFVGKSIRDANQRNAEEREYLIAQREHAEDAAQSAREEAERQRQIATDLRTELIKFALASQLGRLTMRDLDDLTDRIEEIGEG
jgi:flagellar biosynthesis component FlhA